MTAAGMEGRGRKTAGTSRTLRLWRCVEMVLKIHHAKLSWGGFESLLVFQSVKSCGCDDCTQCGTAVVMQVALPHAPVGKTG